MKPCYLSFLSAWLAVVAIPAAAQTTSAPKPDDAVVLSPFTVNAASDVGYVATNTLAGSRLNTALKDTAASISVMTSEFLNDIGAFDVQSAMAYGSNVQNELSEEGPAGNRLTEFFNTYRIRGIRASGGRNYFLWVLPTDTYNIDRIDQSRGPNSILFGVGSAGGIINASTKQPVAGRKFQTLGLVVGSYDYYRATLDVNQPLNPRAGLRFNAVWDDQKSDRHFVYKKNQSSHLSAKWNPWSQTTIRAEGELGYLEENNARPWTLFDAVSTWNNANRPTVTFATAAANAALGIARYPANAARATYIANNNSLLDLRGALISTVPTPTPANDYLILDRRIADYEVNPAGPGEVRTTGFKTYTAAIEQRLGQHSTIEAAYNLQDYDFVSYDAGNGVHQLIGDPTATLPTGAANPFARGYFIDTNWTRRWRTETAENFRLTASTAFDLKKWGAYRLAALGERQKNTYRRDERREFFDGSPFAALPDAAPNLVFRRTYVTEGNWATYAANGGKGQLISGMRDPVSGQTLSSTWIQQSQSFDDDPSRLDSLLAGLEARYFQNRLVAVAGVRRDKLHNENRGVFRDPATNRLAINYAAVDRTSFSYRTQTFGLVGHVLPWLSLLYNQSTNNAIPNIAHRILPDDGRPKGAQGEGQDIGFTVSLPNNKAYFKAVYYTTDSLADTDFRVTQGIVTRGSRVLDALVAGGLITEAQAAPRRRNASAVTFDRKSSGYEFELVANPTPQWRVSANYTRSDLVEDNVGAEAIAWAEGEISYWQSVPRYTPTIVTATGVTIAEEIQNQRTTLSDMSATNGRGAIGNRRDKMSLVTRYGFEAGPLKNAFVGGAIRYQSGAVVGRAVNRDLIIGNSMTITDAFVGYRLRIAKRMVNLQLNVNNLFEFEKPQTTVTSPTGGIRRFSLVPPRTLRLSARLEF